MRAFLLPITFLAPAIFVDYLLYQNLLPHHNVIKISHIFRPFRILCYGCYCVHAFYFHILQGKPPDAERSCVFDKREFECQDKLRFHRELPQRMLGHLRIVGFITMHTRLVCRRCGELLAMACSLGIEFITDPANCFPLCIKNVWWIALASLFGLVWLIQVFVYLPSFCEIFIMLSFPIATLCTTTDLIRLWHVVNINFLHRYLLFAVRFVLVLLYVSLSCLAALGVMFVLRSAAVGVMILLQLAVTFVPSVDNLPSVAFCVLSSYYLWISYRSFT